MRRSGRTTRILIDAIQYSMDHNEEVKVVIHMPSKLYMEMLLSHICEKLQLNKKPRVVFVGSVRQGDRSKIVFDHYFE